MLDTFREERAIIECTLHAMCTSAHLAAVCRNTMLPSCVTFTCLPLAPLHCQNAWSVKGILRCGCGMVHMFYMFHVCLQAGSSLHGPTQTADTPLPPSPVYKDSCEHFSWPLLEPQVLVMCILSHMNVIEPASCGLYHCCPAFCFLVAFWWLDSRFKPDFACEGL